MLPPTEQPTICFAHVAYRLRERFLALATGIESFEVSDGAAPEQRIGEADVLVISGLWRNDLLPRAMPAEGGNHWSEKNGNDRCLQTRNQSTHVRPVRHHCRYAKRAY